jgi:RNA polymerase sigma factor (sigma-70 family)
MDVITEQSDASLLQAFARYRSQDAFSTLVSRHCDWVYWAAVRMVHDPHLAEDVVQAVFLILSEKAGNVGRAPLHRWLFKVTRYASSNAIRSRTRREKHERRAAMQTSETYQPETDRTWDEISPVLDDSIGRLKSKDRDAVLLHFYQQKEMPEVAAALGVSEGAAKVRIVRAMHKLRKILRRKSVLSAADLSVVLAAHITRPAPAHVAGGCGPGSASTAASSIASGTSTMMALAKAKIAAVLIVLMVIPIGAAVRFALQSDVQPDTGAQQPTPPGAVIAPNPPPPSAAADDTPGLDPRVAAYVTPHTDVILAVDVTKLDLDALATDMRTELSKSPTDPAVAAHIDQMLLMGQNYGKRWFAGFEQAGGTNVYVVIRSDQLFAAAGSAMPFNVRAITVVFPADSNDAATKLAQYLASPGGKPPAVIGNAVVINPPAWDPAIGSGSRDMLAAGLAAGGDNAVRSAVIPTNMPKIISAFMKTAGGNFPMFNDMSEWEGVESTSLCMVLPPATSPCLMGISHYSDAAMAQAAIVKGNARLARTVAEESKTATPMGQSVARFLQSEKLTLRGSDIVATMELHPYWDMVFQSMAYGMKEASSRPQAPPPGSGL